MFSIFKKSSGTSKNANDEQNSDAASIFEHSSVYTILPEDGAFNDMERDAPEKMKTSSHQFPEDSYFELTEVIRNAMVARRYETVANAARKSIVPLEKWLTKTRGERSREQIDVPLFHEGGTMMAMTGDLKGLKQIRDIAHEFEYLNDFRVIAVKHLEDVELFKRIRQVIKSKPGVLQNTMKTELSEKDGRHVSQLISWLVKAGEITRAKSGKTYALYMVGVHMSEEDAAAVYFEPPRPCSHQKERAAVQARELNLNKLNLVTLPPSPDRWQSRAEELPTTVEIFSDLNSTWGDLRVEPVVPSNRLDPAFRKHFKTRDGILSFDDLAKSADSKGAAGAVKFTPVTKGKETIRTLRRPIYAIDVHHVGKGFAVRSRANILTIYNENLELDFETDLSATLEVETNRKRLERGWADVDPFYRFWKEWDLYCIAVSAERNHYLYSHVDEAWCISRDGSRLWGIRIPEMPEMKIKTYSEGTDDVVHKFGAESNIDKALKEMGLQMPFTQEEVHLQYKALVRQLQIDLNAETEDRIKILNLAYEVLTGIKKNDIYRNASEDNHLSPSQKMTVLYGYGPDRIVAATFSGSDGNVLLGTLAGRVLRIDQTGQPIEYYDVGSTPRRILETDNYLYIQTDNRLYVLDGDRLVGFQACTAKCNLLVDGSVVLLIESKGVRVLSETGYALSTILTKAPVRRAIMENGELVVETRMHRGHFSGLRV